MTEELKPCPFCGEQEIQAFKPRTERDLDVWLVRCSCGARSGGWVSEAHAIKAWNTRK